MTRRHVQMGSRLVAMPPFFEAIPLDIECPHCHYLGTPEINNAKPQFFPGFRAKQFVQVRYDIIGAAQHRAGDVELLTDVLSFEIDEIEPPRETTLECGNCERSFEPPHPLRFTRTVKEEAV